MAEVVIMRDAAAAGALAADAIEAVVRRLRRPVIGLATGSTPLVVYAELARRGLHLGGVRWFALDEYVGLAAGHPQSYRAVIDRDVVDPLRLDRRRVRVPGEGPVESAGRRFEAQIRAAGGVDLQLLGIGTTGHIGFNEPGSSLASLTRVKTLTQQTRRDNARFFTSPEDVPRHCITQGLGTILRAKHLVLLAFGATKAAAVASAVEGPVTSSAPGSAIQLHPHVTVLLDEAAAAGLRDAEYYRSTWRDKPAWQGL